MIEIFHSVLDNRKLICLLYREAALDLKTYSNPLSSHSLCSDSNMCFIFQSKLSKNSSKIKMGSGFRIDSGNKKLPHTQKKEKGEMKDEFFFFMPPNFYTSCCCCP